MSSVERMQVPLCVESADQVARIQGGVEDASEPGYVLLILQAMEAQQFGLRRMELKTRLNRARLGRILHRDPAKRCAMTIVEFRSILAALGIDPLEAIIATELVRELDLTQDARFAKISVMLATLVRGLPQRLVEALHDFDGMDGSEIRAEWGTFFQKAVVNRMVHEVSQILERRAKLSSIGDPFSF